MAKRLELSPEVAQKLISDAGSVLEKLRRRSECRKFLRERIIPRKGRSSAKILAALKELGITELFGLAHTDAATLKKAGVSDAEAEQILTEAKAMYYGQVLKEIGIPAVSLKKYLAAGIIKPEMFCERTPEALSKLTGVSAATVQRHVDMVCTFLNKPLVRKSTETQNRKGQKRTARNPGNYRFSCRETLHCGNYKYFNPAFSRCRNRGCGFGHHGPEN